VEGRAEMSDVVEVAECSFEACPFYKEMTGGPCWDECTCATKEYPNGRMFTKEDEMNLVDGGFPEWCPLKDRIMTVTVKGGQR
jgi:hypothetical protein